MGNPVNLKEFPRAEFWADTKWGPYKEGIQQEIRRHLTTNVKDLAEWIEFTIDLDEGDRVCIYTTHFFPKTQVPADVVDPWKKKMMAKAKNKQQKPSPSGPTSGSVGTRITRQRGSS